MPRRARTQERDSTEALGKTEAPKLTSKLGDVLRNPAAFGVPHRSVPLLRPKHEARTAIEQKTIDPHLPRMKKPEDKPASLSTAPQVPTPGHLLCGEKTSDSRSAMTTSVSEGHQPLQGTDQDTMELEPLEADPRELDNELKSKQKDLDTFDSSYRDWKSLKAKLSKSRKILKEILIYIENLEQRKSDFERENTKTGSKLKSVQSSTLRRQEDSLKSLLREGVSSSTQDIVNSLLQRIKTEKEEIGVQECLAITTLKAKYQWNLEKYHKDIEAVKIDISKIFMQSGIEIKIDIIDTYIHEDNDHPLKNAQECTTRLATTLQRTSDIESGQALKDANREWDEKWDEMRSTRFFQQRVMPLRGRFFLTANIETLDAAIKFSTEQECQQKTFRQKVQDLEDQQKTFRQKVQGLYPKLEEGLQKPGLREANSLYEALLDQHGQALKALEKGNELRRKLQGKKKASGIGREGREKDIEFLETAIADLKNSEEDQKKHYLEFTGQRDIIGYREISDLYKAMLKKNEALVEANKKSAGLKRNLEHYNEILIPAAQKMGNQDDDSEFGEKLEAFIRARISIVKQYKMLTDNIKLVCDYYDSIAIIPLQDIASQNQEAIASIENDIADGTSFYEKEKKEQDTIEAAMEEIRGTSKTDLIQEADGAMNVSLTWLDTQRRKLRKEIEDLTSRQERIRGQPESPPPSQEALGGHDTDSTSTPTLREIARQEGASDQSLKWLNVRDIAEYTDSLRKVHLETYKTAMHIDKAVASAKFLSDQRLIVEDPEKYLAIAADLVHEFDAGLNSFHFNSKTFQVEVVNPSDTNRNRRDLVPVRLSRRGDLLIDNKRLKGSVIASQKGDPFVWILSKRGEMAHGRRLFAANTVMQQSGSGNFEDLGKLKKGGKMGIFDIIAEREFAEEAKGFKIVSGTLKKVKDISRGTEHVRFFTAQAEGTNTVIDTKENDETIGTWSLDVMKLIKQHKLDIDYDFHRDDKKSRLRVKQYMLEAAFKEKGISRFPAETDPEWHEYFRDSYDVNHMVDCIRELSIKVRSQAQNVSWRLRGEDRWFRIITSLGSQ